MTIDYVPSYALPRRSGAGFLPPKKIFTIESIVFWTSMPLEFVQATIDEMPGGSRRGREHAGRAKRHR